MCADSPAGPQGIPDRSEAQMCISYRTKCGVAPQLHNRYADIRTSVHTCCENQKKRKTDNKRERSRKKEKTRESKKKTQKKRETERERESEKHSKDKQNRSENRNPAATCLCHEQCQTSKLILIRLARHTTSKNESSI